MSKETWIMEYYPVPASKCKKADALEHSLRKWIGFRLNNLRKHDIVSGPPIDIGSGTCSLCRHFYKKDSCETCPLYQIRGISCAEQTSREASRSEDSPFDAFAWEDDPEPMIRLIRKAIKAQEKKDVR